SGGYTAWWRANVRARQPGGCYSAREEDAAFYTLSRCHNVHSKLYAAMFLGQLKPALAAAASLEAAVSEGLLRDAVPPMADWLEGFLSMKVHALIRFGRWAEVLAEPLPADPDLYCVTTAMLRYGRGVALAATGDVAGAEAERPLFQQAVARVPESRTVFNNRCLDILAVAAAMLDEIGRAHV